jgi:DNA-directed RNA polymerase subunit RPC12/RpoP
LINLVNSNRRIRVIDPTSERRLKCEECGQPTLHIYKQDPTLYFCGNCANTVPIQQAKHELVVIPTEAEKQTFIVQSKRKQGGRKKGRLEQHLEQKGLMVSDYVEIKPQPD